MVHAGAAPFEEAPYRGILGRRLEQLDAAAEVGDGVDEAETFVDTDETTDEADDGNAEDEDVEEKGGTLPNLLRRRNKGLLAKELRSLTD